MYTSFSSVFGVLLALIFLILIDDLRLPVLCHKYVDDTMISETVDKDETSQMQSVIDELVELANWSGINHMNINGKKTKEMILGPLRSHTPPPLTILDQTVD